MAGFQCSKNLLIGLNVFYIIVGITLISLGSYWTSQNGVTSLPIIGGAVACGIFLLIIAILGVYGASKHHQVMLFFYMVILFLLFLIQFSIACACLAVSHDSQVAMASAGWRNLDNNTKGAFQKSFLCCGFDTYENSNITRDSGMDHPSCYDIQVCTAIQNQSVDFCKKGPSENCCVADGGPCGCELCKVLLLPNIDYAFRVVGGVSLFFSFTEFLGVWLTVRHRNQKDPYVNPSAFL